jgi:hypothetical protein
MSQSKSTYLRQAIYNAILKNTAFTGAATLYASLHTAAPGLTGANEVPSTNAYARVAVTFGTPTAGAGSNSAAPTWPAPTPANWGTVTHFGIWDAATGGNYYLGDALTAAVATSIGVPVTAPIGNLTYAEL